MVRRIGSMKKTLTQYFNLWVRLNEVDANGYGYCCSCGQLIHWTDGDAGHFVGRANHTLKWDERNVHLQCRQCNYMKDGDRIGYHNFMVENYGQETVEELRRLAKTVRKWRKPELQEMIDTYRERLKAMKRPPK
jgi:hypothetical protein